jgi:hypothetical protein
MAGKITSKNVETGEVVSGDVVNSGQIIEANAQNAPVKDILWDASQLETKSETHLEDDAGYGQAAIVRSFVFSANPEAFKQYTPTKQELFNHHYKQIEIMLWQDGMVVMPDVNPKVTINNKKTKYRIFVGAKPMKGHILKDAPKTLSNIAHNGNNQS